jgi:4-hydroxy-2-oxoglutarate aldolase
MSDMTDEQRTLSARLSAEALRGVLLPFVTTFEADEELNAGAIGTNIDRWNRVGVRGYVALGSTGERVHLSERECLEVLETARRHVPSTLALIAGAGQQSVRLTIDEVRRWASAGADAVLVITPNYYRAEMTQGVLFDYFSAVADVSPVPVLLYSIPQLTGIRIESETIARLAAHENIIGVKDSSGDVPALRETLSLVREDFAVMTGHGAALYDALSAGAHGAILAVGCFASRACVEIYRAHQAKDFERARAIQNRVAFLVRGVMGGYGIGGIKAAMDMLGYTGGRVREPLNTPDEAGRIEIAKLVRESELFEEELKATGREQRFGAGVI